MLSIRCAYTALFPQTDLKSFSANCTWVSSKQEKFFKYWSLNRSMHKDLLKQRATRSRKEFLLQDAETISMLMMFIAIRPQKSGKIYYSHHEGSFECKSIWIRINGAGTSVNNKLQVFHCQLKPISSDK